MYLFSVKGNPEFKLFIQELGEANSLEDLEQSPAILTFRAARCCTYFKDLGGGQPRRPEMEFLIAILGEGFVA
jgi:hypothetical protein